MQIRYARVSTREQNLNLQIDSSWQNGLVLIIRYERQRRPNSMGVLTRIGLGVFERGVGDLWSRRYKDRRSAMIDALEPAYEEFSRQVADTAERTTIAHHAFMPGNALRGRSKDRTSE